MQKYSRVIRWINERLTARQPSEFSIETTARTRHCAHCRMRRKQHVGDRCLLSPTKYLDQLIFSANTIVYGDTLRYACYSNAFTVADSLPPALLPRIDEGVLRDVLLRERSRRDGLR